MTLSAATKFNLSLAVPPATDLAILRTVLYADVFDYPLTLHEIQRYLIGEALPVEAVQAALALLGERIANADGCYFISGRASLVDLRRERNDRAARLWQAARRYGRIVGHLPFVRMVAVTGALAVDNVKPNDDIDFLIVTVPGRVWLARAFAIFVVRLARLIGVHLCPNYILAETALAQDRRDLFVAHELAQMIPLTGHALYWQMRALNAWVADFLPNAPDAPRLEPDFAPRGPGWFLQRVLEALLSGTLGERLEQWERSRKMAKFQPQLKRAGTSAVLDEAQVKGHFNDYGERALEAYLRRCAEHQVQE
jgi:hypothetical protein